MKVDVVYVENGKGKLQLGSIRQCYVVSERGPYPRNCRSLEKGDLKVVQLDLTRAEITSIEEGRAIIDRSSQTLLSGINHHIRGDLIRKELRRDEMRKNKMTDRKRSDLESELAAIDAVRIR